MSKKLRLVFVTNNYTPYSGGVVSSIASSVAALHAAGHDVSIITLDFLGKKHQDPAYVVRVQCPIKFTYKANPMAVPWRSYAQVLHHIKAMKPDVIHAHHPFLLGRDALKSARAERIPIVFTYHTIYERYLHYVPLPQPVTKPVVTKLVLDYCQSVDGIVAPSGAIKTYLQEQNIATPTMVIPSGLQRMFVKQMHNEHAKKNTAQLPFNLLVVSRFTKEKNIPFILDMFAQLSQQENYCLTLVGYGEYAKQLQEYAYHTLQLSQKQVQFVHKPPKKELLRYYGDADLFLFSSTTDTQGLVLAEAMACATPAVALDGPGQRDIIRNGFNGFLVSSVQEMGAAVTRIARDKALHEKLCNGAHKTAHRYNPATITGQLIGLYKNAMDLSAGL